MAQSIIDLLENKNSSESIDNALGFRVSEIEKELLLEVGHFKSVNKNKFYTSETWIGLEPQMLQTPYWEILEFYNILSQFNPFSYVDLGAGYSRLGVVLNLLEENFQYTGYELVEKRVQESIRVFNKNSFKNFNISQKDIMKDKTIPKADVYFIYDFSSPIEQVQILDLFSKKMYKDDFFLVARGHGIRSLIQNKYKEFYVCNGAIHKDKYSIYSSHIDISTLKDH